MRLLALLLRTRGQCYLLGTANVRGCGLLPPWWFYRVGAWAATPEVGDWGRRLNAVHPPDGSGDWGPLALFDRPLEGIIARIARALRARDRVLATVLGFEGNESHDVILYEAESLALQLSGALDVAAAATGLQLGLTTDQGKPLKPTALKLHRRDFTAAIRRQGAGITGADLKRWRGPEEMLGLIRNRIHSAPAVPVAGDDAVWFVLPKQDQTRFNARANKLGGMTAWGVKSATGPASALIDPWTLTEKSIAVVRDVLSEIASKCLAQLPPADVADEPWPWDPATGDSALSLLGL